MIAVAFASILGLLAQLAGGAAFAQGERSVELELVLAIDTSTSVNAAEYLLQRDGLAAAFRHPETHRAIASLGSEGMAVAVVQWAGTGQQTRAVGWAPVSSPETAIAFAAALSVMPRQLAGFTDIAGAIAFSHAELDANPYRGRRRTIDVSGDGTSERADPAPVRDRAVADGITVNGLIIQQEEYDLGELATIALRRHYRERVIGGPGAFLMEIEGFEQFSEAIRRKLVREIRGTNIADALSRRTALSAYAPAR